MEMDSGKTLNLLCSFILMLVSSIASIAIYSINVSHNRLKDVSFVLRDNLNVEKLENDLKSIALSKDDLQIYSLPFRLEDWIDIPSGVTALRPDSIFKSKNSVVVVWKGALGAQVVLSWSPEEGVYFQGK